MAVYTCITENRDFFHLTQHAATGPDAALRNHIAALPFDDGFGQFNDELEWLTRVSNGSEPVEMLPVGNCRGTWLWQEGLRTEPRYVTYVVRSFVDYSWLILTRRLSQEECDRDWGGAPQHWDVLRSQMTEFDEIWEYECSIGNRHELSGASGVCLKRGDCIIDHVVTRQIFE